MSVNARIRENVYMVLGSMTIYLYIRAVDGCVVVAAIFYFDSKYGCDSAKRQHALHAYRTLICLCRNNLFKVFSESKIEFR